MESEHESKCTATKEEEEDAVLIPVSPVSQALNSPLVTLFILPVFELETLISEYETLEFLRNEIVPSNVRFSSIIEIDNKGVERWKKVEIRVEDILIIPTFPVGLQREEYNEHMREYLSKIGRERISGSKPLWEAHLIKYPTLNGVGALIFKLSHVMGDGYSFVKVLCNAFKRADNPTLPLTFPNLSFRGDGVKEDCLGFSYKCINTVYDFFSNLSKATVLEDRPSAIRAVNKKMDIRPISIYTLTVSLERAKQLKSKLRATINDVIMGIISYTIHLYMVRMDQISINKSMTMLVMLNMRVLKGFKNIDEMVRAPESWGNHSRFLHVSIPRLPGLEKVNPLDFITKAKKEMKRRKNAYVYLIDTVLKVVRNVTGQKGLSRMVYSSLYNATTLLSSVVGPKEQLAVAGHSINSFYYLITGIPQSLVFTSVSCMGELKLVAEMEKGFIDSKVFSGCMNQAFEDMIEAAFASAGLTGE